MECGFITLRTRIALGHYKNAEVAVPVVVRYNRNSEIEAVHNKACFAGAKMGL